MNMQKKFRLIYILLFWLVSCVALAAESPLPMLQNTSDQLLSALQQNKATLKSNPQVVYNLVHQILLPHIDLQGMARSVLGRNVWQNATPQQQEQFTYQFTELLVHTYSSALAAYQDQTVKFFPLRGNQGGQTHIQVNSQILQNGGPPITVNYRLVLQGDEWKVFDFSVDGVSMLESFRSQFATELSNGNLDALIKKLANHNAQAANNVD